MGSATRLYELREFFPLRLPEQVNEFILNYVPFILGIFVTTVAALAGLIVSINWILNGFRHLSRFRVSLRSVGDYYHPENVSLGLKDGKLHSYDKSPSIVFSILGRFWKNARYISEIPGEIARWNMRFIWKALFIGIAVHLLFRVLDLVPIYLSGLGLGTGYVVPSPFPLYNLLAHNVCAKGFDCLKSHSIEIACCGARNGLDDSGRDGSSFSLLFHIGGRVSNFRPQRFLQQNLPIKTCRL